VIGGPGAPAEAIARALAQAEWAAAVVIVEGVSDQIALETLADRLGRDLDADGVVILPAGGAHAIAPFLERFGPSGHDLTLAGLCDAAEEDVFRGALTSSGIGSPSDRADLERLGFHVCVEDLEDELVRAVGLEGVEAVLDAEGDLRSFRTLQHQAPWQDQPVEAQLRRFFGSGARRKLRYAGLLVEAAEWERIPRPLTAVLESV
jgi:hypothetical protein